MNTPLSSTARLGIDSRSLLRSSPTLIALASSLALLAGCGGGDTSSQTASSTDAQASASTTAAETGREHAMAAADPAAPSAVGKFAIAHSTDVLETTETPISLAFLNDHVAGSKGPVKNVGGKFYTGSDRLRIYGMVLYGGATMPNKSDAIKIAQRLRKEGFNGVRMIGFDKELAKANTWTLTHENQGLLNNDQTLNSGALDYFDHFVYQLQQAGIYVQIPMKVSRIYLDSPDCIDYCEGIDRYVPALIDSQKKYAAALLNHVNPYTGKAYKADPGVMAFEISNESSISHRWSNGTLDTYATNATLYAKYGALLVSKWVSWAQAKYGTPEAAAAAWGTTSVAWSSLRIPLKANKATTSAALYADFAQFLGEMDGAFMKEMYTYIKNTVGTSTLVLGTQSHYAPLYAREYSDISDYHSYFGGVTTDTGLKNPANGRPVYSVDNKSLLMYTDPMSTSLFGVHERKAIDKPNMISEYVHRYGNQYIAESEPIISAYAGFQDIDAIFMTNAHNMNLNTNTDYYSGWFNNTVAGLSRVSAALAFRRGDMTPGAPYVMKTTKQSYVNATGKFKSWNLINFHLGGGVRAPIVMNTYQQLVNSTAEEAVIKYSPPADNIYTTTTGQMTWKPMDRMIIDSPMTKTVVGLFNKTALDLGAGIKVNLGSTMSNFAVVQVSSLTKGAKLPSGKMLLTLSGYWNVPGEYKYPRAPGSSSFSWGSDVPRAEAITSTVRITTPLSLTVTALDSTGARKASVPVVRNGADIEFVTGPAYDTGWYLIESGTTTTTPPANVAPTVSLSAASSGTVGVATTLTASAADSDGTVAKVEFFDNGALVGTDTSAPYSVSWAPTSAGNHTLTVRATDNDGASTTGSAVSMNVVSTANKLPTVSLSAPSTGTVGTTTTVTASASDSDGSVSKVEFFDNGTLVATDTSAPYSVSWAPPTSGTHSLTARATDNAGGSSTSAAVNMSVSSPSNAPPSVSLNASSTTVPVGSSVALTATADDSDGSIAKVEFYAGSTLIATETVIPYTAKWTPTAAGTSTLTARATDNLGATKTSASISVTAESTTTPTPPTPPTSGNGGLFAEYFTNANLQGSAVVSRIEPLSFVWGSASPAPGVPADYWSARWTGYITVPETGTYTLQLTADDGVRFTVNGLSVANKWSNSGNVAYVTQAATLTAGTRIPVTVEHYDGTGNSTVMLRWKTPSSGGYWTDIPAAQYSTLSGGTSNSSTSSASGGLLANYYANLTMSGTPVVSRIDGANFAWGSSAPAAGLPRDGWSARWTGYVTIPTAGNYTFQIVGDDGTRARVDGTLIANNWSNGGNATFQSTTAALAAGKRIPVIIEHFDGSGDSTIRLRWKSPDSGAYWQDIPVEQLSSN